ncbi:hypothetical protein [Paenibacillus sp. HJGM_3]|uniref:YphA family membrane protein n=1 Tax=Paenibacillus sp. HJGM_3 TaxID=3379816 RepID=UPI00385B29B7
MNPGYLSLILLCSAVILLASGWKSALLPGLRDRGLIAFLIGWLVLSQIHIPGPGSAQAEIGLVLIPILIFVLHRIGSCETPVKGLHLVSIGLFLGSLYALLHHALRADPLLLPLHSPVAAGIVVGLTALFLTRDPGDQLCVVSLGIVIGTGLVAYVRQNTVPFLWGGRTFQDEWWASVAAVRLASLAFESVWVASSGLMRKRLVREERDEQEREE